MGVTLSLYRRSNQRYECLIGIPEVERMRNPTCIDFVYHVVFHSRSTRPTKLIPECYKYLPKYLKLNNPDNLSNRFHFFLISFHWIFVL